MKKHSKPLVIKEMQIKTTIRYHLLPVRMAIINKCTSADKDVEKRKHSCTVGGMQINTATVENSMEVPQKIKYGTAL